MWTAFKKTPATKNVLAHAGLPNIAVEQLDHVVHAMRTSGLLSQLTKQQLANIAYAFHAAGQHLPRFEPTVFHITHWKAGSQWINRVLHILFFDRLVLPVTGQTQFFNEPIQPGKIYPTVYVTRQQFDGKPLPSNHRRFVIIRDLRDTLVSLYFSVKNSHRIVRNEMHQSRTELQQKDVNAGLQHVMENMLPDSAEIQRSWVTGEDSFFRYEDFLQDDFGMFQRILDRCDLKVDSARLQEVVAANRFESITGGRNRGQEDVTAHERKGVSGDWRNYFSESLKRTFKRHYGELLITTGYEKNLNW